MKQESGNNSENLQAGRDIYYGISATECRQIALDIFKANFYEFSEKALKIANKRVEEITDEFIKDFFKDNLNKVEKLENPSIQSSLFNMQKEYAKTGGEQLKERLVLLLKNRINSEERSLEQICFDESIKIIPKITNDQINILSFLFCTRTFSNGSLTSLGKFDNFLNFLTTLIPKELPSNSFFSHLSYVGCISNIEGHKQSKQLEEILKNLYTALFVKGFTQEELMNEFDIDILKINKLIILCAHDKSKYQFKFLSNTNFKKDYQNSEYKNLISKITNFQDKYVMKNHEIKSYVISRNKNMINVFNFWNHEEFKSIKLTSVGITIAIINYNIGYNENLKFTPFI